MKRDKILGVRLPEEMHKELERARRRMSKLVGSEVKISMAVRALLKRALREDAARA